MGLGKHRKRGLSLNFQRMCDHFSIQYINDSVFWLYKEYSNLTIPQTLRTWTVMETTVSLDVLALNRVV